MNKFLKLLVSGTGVVAVALFALGCGSSGSDGETVAALTKPQFIKLADQACAKAAKKREAAAVSWRKEHPGESQADGLNRVFQEVLVPSIEEQIEALEALAVPAADKAEVARMLDNLTEANGNFATEGVEGTQQPELSLFQAEAKKYGLKICPRLY